jgi:hypothetical protein
MPLTRAQLEEKWRNRAKEYQRLSDKASYGDICAEDHLDPSVHYQTIADTFQMCANELSHLRE